MDNDNTNTNTENTESKPRGQRPKTEAEIRTLFNECVQAIGAEGLRLKVETRMSTVKKDGVETEKESLRCSVFYVDDSSITDVIAPVAGNTFARLLEGAKCLGPYAAIQ